MYNNHYVFFRLLHRSVSVIQCSSEGYCDTVLRRLNLLVLMINREHKEDQKGWKPGSKLTETDDL
jgi:hypothetical protein